MREKVIDIALIVTLIIVAFGITWTLLTLNRGDSRPASTPAAGEQRDNGTTEITPLPIDRGAQEEAEAPEARPRRQPPAEESSQRSEQAGVEAAEASAPDPEPVPPGPVRIERIGFSFVTGGAGACGIVLEPWRHVAVSRELLAAYGCGAEVAITLDDEKGGRREFSAIVADTMNPSFSRTVNIYVGEDEPALEYGVTSGMLRP